VYRYVVVVISLWSVIATAADWQVVADNDQGQLRLDKATVSTEGKYTKAVLVFHFKKQQRFSSPPNEVFDDRQDDVLVDCSNPSMGILTSRFFDGEKLVNTIIRKQNDIKFKPSVPDTMVETVVKAVCTAVSKH
jgi:hypothetical protein